MVNLSYYHNVQWDDISQENLPWWINVKNQAPMEGIGMKVRTGTVVQLVRENCAGSWDGNKEAHLLYNFVLLLSTNTYSLFQSTFFSHVAASKGDTNQFLLSPVSVIQTAEIFVIHQNQGEYLAVKRLPCRDLTPAASKYIIEKEAESLTPSGLYSLQTCAFPCWSCPSRFVDNSLWDIDTESMIT